MPLAPAIDWRSLYPFTSHWRTVRPGIRQHYLDEGRGDPVVCLHGNPTWSFYFRDVILGLRDIARVVVPDHVGCGLSDKPQLYPYRLADHVRNAEQLLIEELDLRRITLVLHDWGGAIGMGVAVRHPERIARLVVLNTAAFVLPHCPLRIRACRIPGLGPLLVRGLNAFARAALHMAVVHRERLTPAVRAGFLAPYDSWRNRIATLRFVQDIPLRPQHPAWATVNGIAAALPALRDKPMLIGWGERDFCFSEPFLQEWLRRFPQAAVHRYPDAGHYVLQDAHERIVPEIRRFTCPPAARPI